MIERDNDPEQYGIIEQIANKCVWVHMLGWDGFGHDDINGKSCAYFSINFIRNSWEVKKVYERYLKLRKVYDKV